MIAPTILRALLYHGVLFPVLLTGNMLPGMLYHGVNEHIKCYSGWFVEWSDYSQHGLQQGLFLEPLIHIEQN